VPPRFAAARRWRQQPRRLSSRRRRESRRARLRATISGGHFSPTPLGWPPRPFRVRPRINPHRPPNAEVQRPAQRVRCNRWLGLGMLGLLLYFLFLPRPLLLRSVARRINATDADCEPTVEAEDGI
jgi:hypothetical protein